VWIAWDTVVLPRHPHVDESALHQHSCFFQVYYALAETSCHACSCAFLAKTPPNIAVHVTIVAAASNVGSVAAVIAVAGTVASMIVVMRLSVRLDPWKFPHIDPMQIYGQGPAAKTEIPSGMPHEPSGPAAKTEIPSGMPHEPSGSCDVANCVPPSHSQHPSIGW